MLSLECGPEGYSAHPPPCQAHQYSTDGHPASKTASSTALNMQCPLHSTRGTQQLPRTHLLLQLGWGPFPCCLSNHPECRTSSRNWAFSTTSFTSSRGHRYVKGDRGEPTDGANVESRCTGLRLLVLLPSCLRDVAADIRKLPQTARHNNAAEVQVS